jgi:hypothetical protein
MTTLSITQSLQDGTLSQEQYNYLMNPHCDKFRVNFQTADSSDSQHITIKNIKKRNHKKEIYTNKTLKQLSKEIRKLQAINPKYYVSINIRFDLGNPEMFGLVIPTFPISEGTIVESSLEANICDFGMLSSCFGLSVEMRDLATGVNHLFAGHFVFGGCPRNGIAPPGILLTDLRTRIQRKISRMTRGLIDIRLKIVGHLDCWSPRYLGMIEPSIISFAHRSTGRIFTSHLVKTLLTEY